MRKENNKKSILILITVFVLISALCGCGVSDETRRKLYNQVIKTGDLDLDVSSDEYEEIKTVSNAPIPGVTTYYIYRGTDESKYTFQFLYLGLDDYDYKVKVNKEYGNASSEEDKEIPELNIGYEYLFKKGKVTRRIKLVDSEQSSYFRRFSENDSKLLYGIKTFSLYQGKVKLYFDGEIVDSRIEKIINDIAEGNVSKYDVTIRTDKGEYKSEEINSNKYNSGNSLVLSAKNEAEGIPEWIEIDGIRIDLSIRGYISE